MEVEWPKDYISELHLISEDIGKELKTIGAKIAGVGAMFAKAKRNVAYLDHQLATLKASYYKDYQKINPDTGKKYTLADADSARRVSKEYNDLKVKLIEATATMDELEAHFEATKTNGFALKTLGNIEQALILKGDITGVTGQIN